WCKANKSSVGIHVSSQSTFRLPRLENPNSPDKPTILSPDASIVLNQ
ncbi:19450_t:CDS:2, partial [Racocetra persica]